ncbi:MFS transporter [Micromonospora arborensis]|uniref:MFS transporter n=1 Tax=Micromonospora arborensis TaxID=2116518 RepID=UPI0034121AFA
MRTATARPPMTQNQRRLGMAACLLTIVLALLDSNIVSAAAVPIVRELDPVHGVARLPWLVSAFALAATAALPLYGKLCDVLGAKPVYLGAVATFLAGSALCGVAQGMTQLIAFRAVQGIGAGGLMSVTMVVMAHLVDRRQQGGNLGGLIGGFGMAIGPLLGGLIVDHTSWRWIFYLNLPLGLLVLVTATVVLRLPRQTERRRIDFAGAAMAAAFAVVLLLSTEWGGDRYAWTSPVMLSLVGAAVALFGLFLWRQATAAEPILPLSMFRIPTLRLSFAIQGLVGAAMMGALIYLMVYLQVLRGLAASSAALFLVPMALGLSFVGIVSGWLTARGWSTKTFLVSGTATAAAALGFLATLGADTSLWLIRADLFLLGAGFGQLLGLLIAAVQQAAPPTQLGVATTSVRFFQNLGGALGAAISGSVLARVYAGRMPGETVGGLPQVAPELRLPAAHAYLAGLDAIFAVGCGVLLVALFLATLLRLPDPDTPGGPAPRPTDGERPAQAGEPRPASASAVSP